MVSPIRRSHSQAVIVSDTQEAVQTDGTMISRKEGSGLSAPGRADFSKVRNTSGGSIPSVDQLSAGVENVSLGSGSSSSTLNADPRRPAGRGNNYVTPRPEISPPLQGGWKGRPAASQFGGGSKVVDFNDNAINDDSFSEDESDADDGDDELLSDDSDSDESEKSHGTRKKSGWVIKFFGEMDNLTLEQINEPSRQWHCPACAGGPGAIYVGLQPLMAHAKTKKSERVRLHRVLAELLDEELRRRGTSVVPVGKAFGKWRGLAQEVQDDNDQQDVKTASLMSLRKGGRGVSAPGCAKLPKVRNTSVGSIPSVDQLSAGVENVRLGGGSGSSNPRGSQNTGRSARGQPDVVQKLGLGATSGSGSSSSTLNADPGRPAGKGNNYVAPQLKIAPPLQGGWKGRPAASQFENSSGSNKVHFNTKPITDVADSEDDSDAVDGDDELSSDDFDSDESVKSHGTRKQSRWFKGFFIILDELTLEQINEPLRQWHCPACAGCPGAIDWYEGLQPLMAHAKTKGSKRARLHRELAQLLDEELRRRGSSVVPAGEAFGKWRVLAQEVPDRVIVWPLMAVVKNTQLEQDDDDKVDSQEQLSKDQLETIQEARYAKEDNFEKIQQQEREEVRQSSANVSSAAQGERTSSLKEEEEEDHTSRLPDDIIVTILSLMLTGTEDGEIDAVVRTSVLSRRWRLLWKSSLQKSRLNFTFGPPYLDLPSEPALFTRFVNRVNNTLALPYYGDGVDEFSLTVEFSSDHESETYEPVIHAWIDSMLQKQVKLLSIRLNFYSKVPWDYQVITNNSMESLVSLALDHVDITGEELEYLLDRWTSLKILSVEQSDTLVKLRVSGQLLKLNYLRIWDCFNLEDLDIHDVKLVSLEYSGEEDCIVDIKNTPFLVNALIRQDKYTDEILSYVPQLRNLILQLEEEDDWLQFPEMSNLLRLELEISITDPTFISLLASCPSLVELKIVFAPASESDNKCKLAKCLNHPRLTLVELVGYSGCKLHYGVALAIIENVAYITKMIVDTSSPYMSSTTGRSKEKAIEKAKKDLGPRLDPTVEFVVK